MVGAAVVGRMAAINGRMATVDGEWTSSTDRRIAAIVGEWRLATGNEWPPMMGNSCRNVGLGIHRVARYVQRWWWDQNIVMTG